MAEQISTFEDEQRKIYYRRLFHGDPKEAPPIEEDEQMKDITLFNLMKAFRSAMDRMPRKVVHEVELLNVTVDEQISFTVDYLRVHGQTSLLTLVSHMTEKIRIIVTLIALLELAKNKVISLLPVEGSEDILIRSARTPSGSTSPVGT